jgi:hypothetical protein
MRGYVLLDRYDPEGGGSSFLRNSEEVSVALTFSNLDRNTGYPDRLFVIVLSYCRGS